MKKLLFFSLTLLLFSTLFGCEQFKGPKPTAEQFSAALKEETYENSLLEVNTSAYLGDSFIGSVKISLLKCGDVYKIAYDSTDEDISSTETNGIYVFKQDNQEYVGYLYENVWYKTRSSIYGEFSKLTDESYIPFEKFKYDDFEYSNGYFELKKEKFLDVFNSFGSANAGGSTEQSGSKNFEGYIRLTIEDNHFSKIEAFANASYSYLRKNYELSIQMIYEFKKVNSVEPIVLPDMTIYFSEIDLASAVTQIKQNLINKFEETHEECTLTIESLDIANINHAFAGNIVFVYNSSGFSVRTTDSITWNGAEVEFDSELQKFKRKE